ncbi:CobW family GTP-binding protein [Epibacterium ulvae]|uniref:CobW family GTP-binding protein n=1 Tax=Epibacterium ulvae TaxID=1156985 RepID=UPI002491FB2F|nr:CobW family GTP-binding protein [Epibacterium ulvae]
MSIIGRNGDMPRAGTGRIPVTIISGYLGAGKTTLINRLLAEPHGLNLTVIVNDFGAINIDDHLIQSNNADSIALNNGCICCTMGDDLTEALFQVLTRADKPDHLVIEASGIADPLAIANSVIAQGSLRYNGIVTLVDAINGPELLSDPLLEAQVAQQIRCADLVLINKAQDTTPDFSKQLQKLGARSPTLLNAAPVADLLFDVIPLPRGKKPVVHPSYTTWYHQSDAPLDRRRLGEKLAERPAGLYRMKGFVLTSGGAYSLHVVGRHVEAKRCDATETMLVALGPADRISKEQIENWWTS